VEFRGVGMQGEFFCRGLVDGDFLMIVKIPPSFGAEAAGGARGRL
jgi:hypothetical protein